MVHAWRTRLVALFTLVATAASLCALMITFAPPAAATTTTGRTVAAGNGFSLVLGANGVAMGFGLNTFGQLANPTNNGTATPNPAPSAIGPSNLVAVAAGHTWGVGLDSLGRVWTFGNNQYGQLGRATNAGTGNPNPVSTLVDGLSHVTAIAAGQDHTLALRSDGTVWGFGTNSSGELGPSVAIGAMTTTPVQITGLSHVIAIAAGSGHSLALLADGTVWGFGYNFYGQLGNATNAGSFNPAGNPTPTMVDGLTGVSAISAGTNFSMVLKSDGTVWGFGTNYSGELGTTTNNLVAVPNPTPTQVPGVSSIIAIAADGHHTLALKSAARVVIAWGPNRWGQLGTATNNGTDTPLLPTQVAGLSSASGLATGADHSLAVRADGSLVTFGRNESGELAMTANATPNPTATQLLNVSGLGQPPSFASVVPARLLDTRPGATTIDGQGAGGDLRDADTATAVQVTGRGGVPIDATAVALNVTVTGAQGTGYITAYPCGSSPPTASNLNYQAGSTIANAVIAKVSVAGNVCLYTSAQTQLIVDVNGYYRDSAAFASLVPSRLLDTRPNSPTVDGLSAALGLRSADSTTELQVTGRGGVPANATAVALNVTVNEAQAGGFITVYPCGGAQPNASNLNYGAGSTIPNSVIVKIGTGGKVCLYTSAATQLIVDVNAYLRDTPDSASVVPARLLDTRPASSTVDGLSAGGGLRAGDSVTEVQVGGRGGVPGGATAAVLNVTVTQPQGNAFVTVFPCGSPRPNASNINYFAGNTIANLVIAKIGDDGKVCLYSLAAAHLIVDVNAYYS